MLWFADSKYWAYLQYLSCSIHHGHTARPVKLPMLLQQKRQRFKTLQHFPVDLTSHTTQQLISIIYLCTCPHLIYVSVSSCCLPYILYIPSLAVSNLFCQLMFTLSLCCDLLAYCGSVSHVTLIIFWCLCSAE